MMYLDDCSFIAFRINSSLFFVSKIFLYDLRIMFFKDEACRRAFAIKLCKIGLLYEKSLASSHKLTFKNLRKIRKFKIVFFRFCKKNFRNFALFEVRDSWLTFGRLKMDALVIKGLYIVILPIWIIILAIFKIAVTTVLYRYNNYLLIAVL